MTDLIDRAAIHHALVVELVRCIRDNSVDKGKMSERVLDCVDTVPTVEAEPVKHGRWVHTDRAWSPRGKDECSECQYATADRIDLSYFKYCPNCGAKMDAGK